MLAAPRSSSPSPPLRLPSSPVERPTRHIEVDLDRDHLSAERVETAFGTIERLEATLPVDRLLHIDRLSLAEARRILDAQGVHVETLRIRLPEAVLSRDVAEMGTGEDKSRQPDMRIHADGSFDLKGTSRLLLLPIPYRVHGQLGMTTDHRLLVQVQSARALWVLPVTPIARSAVAAALENMAILGPVTGREGRGVALDLARLAPPQVPLYLQDVRTDEGGLVLEASDTVPHPPDRETGLEGRTGSPHDGHNPNSSADGGRRGTRPAAPETPAGGESGR